MPWSTSDGDWFCELDALDRVVLEEDGLVRVVVMEEEEGLLWTLRLGAIVWWDWGMRRVEGLGNGEAYGRGGLWE